MTTPRARVIRAHVVIACALAAGFLLGSCSSDSEDEGLSPTEVLAEAKKTLDETSGVHVVLATEKLPAGISGIVSADGIGTHPPAFEGDLKIATNGITADAEVVAVDDTVYAKLPFTTEFAEVDPAEYGAPDPADLMAPEGGLSSLLTAVESPEEGKPVREGKTVLTEYSGTVPGDVVAAIIPSAPADTGFAATFTITEDNVLNQAEITGPFYPGTDDVTYTIDFDQYDTEREIAAP